MLSCKLEDISTEQFGAQCRARRACRKRTGDWVWLSWRRSRRPLGQPARMPASERVPLPCLHARRKCERQRYSLDACSLPAVVQPGLQVKTHRTESQRVFQRHHEHAYEGSAWREVDGCRPPHPMLSQASALVEAGAPISMGDTADIFPTSSSACIRRFILAASGWCFRPILARLVEPRQQNYDRPRLLRAYMRGWKRVCWC